MLKADKSEKYVLEFDQYGKVNIEDAKLFQITVGDSVLFKLGGGASLNNKAKLLVNLPYIGEYEVIYTVTPPRRAKEQEQKQVQEIFPLEYDEDNIEYSYLHKIEGIYNLLGDVEFLITFNFGGSFFFQLEFFDTNLNTFSKFPEFVKKYF